MNRSMLAGLVVVIGFAQLTYAADWPWFLGPTHDGVSTETGLLDNWPDGGPPKRWELKTGETYAAPSIVCAAACAGSSGSALSRYLRSISTGIGVSGVRA